MFSMDKGSTDSMALLMQGIAALKFTTKQDAS